MRLCSRAEKSSGDAKRLMRRWGVPEKEWVGVIEKLEAARFIDDMRFSECYVRDKLSFSGWGPYKIRQGLAARGIGKDIIERVMAQDVVAGPARLEALLEKKKKKTRYNSLYELKSKLLRYGAGLGYPYGEVSEAVERITGDEI